MFDRIGLQTSSSNHLHQLPIASPLFPSLSTATTTPTNTCTYLERLEGAGQPSHRPDHLSLVRADDKHTLRRLLRIKHELQAGLDGLHGFLEDLEALLKACQMREREDEGVNGMSE